MAENPFAQFAAQPQAPAGNPFAQFAPAAPSSGIPGPRRGYSLTEVPVEAVKNLPESAGKFVGGVVQAVTSPLQTLTGILDAGAGALRNSLPQGVVNFIDQFEVNPEAAQRAVQTANAIGGMYKDRYGSYEGIKRTFAEDPVGAAADLSTLLTGGGAAATKLGATQTGAALSRTGAAINPMRPIAPIIEQPIKLAAKGVGAVYNALDPKSAAYLTAAEGRGPEIVNALRGQTEIQPIMPPTPDAMVIPIQNPPLDLLASSRSWSIWASILSIFLSITCTRSQSTPYFTGSKFVSSNAISCYSIANGSKLISEF